MKLLEALKVITDGYIDKVTLFSLYSYYKTDLYMYNDITRNEGEQILELLNQKLTDFNIFCDGN